MNHLGAGRYKAVSAGSNPTGSVHPRTLLTLQRHGIAVHNLHSKSWDEFAGEDFNTIITVCDQAAAESCPVFEGDCEKLHWSTPDPSGATGDDQEIDAAFEAAYEMLRKRIENELL